jgi:putative ABC transport system ATP-binding protein
MPDTQCAPFDESNTPCHALAPAPDSAPDHGPATEELIAVSDLHLTLSARHGPVEILRGVNLSIARGEKVSLVGPSGAGKTSLLLVMTGLERASAGQVRVLGAELQTMNEDALARFRRDAMGIVFQDFHLIPTMTALENVAIPLELSGRRDALELAADALSRLGLGARLDHYPAQLSGGEQQRTAIARASVARPPVIFADEPTGNLDQETGAAVMDDLFGISAESGTSLVLITHDPKLAARCDRRIVLRDGRLAT